MKCCGKEVTGPADAIQLLKTWSDTFSEFVLSQEDEIREKIKRLTDAL